jgi:hypothetical protein
VDDFYAARTANTTALPWSNFAPPFSDPAARLSVNRQAIMLEIIRGVYYKPRPVSDVDLKLMHRFDKLHMELPFAGDRMWQELLLL